MSEVTKENVIEAIKFLKTVPPKGFIKEEQTLHFDERNISKYHCVIGWLGVCPASPFFKVHSSNYTVCSGGLSLEINSLVNEKLGERLHVINNDAEKSIKREVIKALKETLKLM